VKSKRMHDKKRGSRKPRLQPLAKNAALSKDLALAREELLAAREDLNVSPARARRNRERAPRRGAPARGEGQGGLRPGNRAAETFGAGRAENA
jgi:hypothetical protein